MYLGLASSPMSLLAKWQGNRLLGGDISLQFSGGKLQWDDSTAHSYQVSKRLNGLLF